MNEEKNIKLKINREDMLTLTRRMTLKRTSLVRIAGAYIDPGGWIDGTFNVRFLNLSAEERSKKLKLAKAIPFAETNSKLKRYRFRQKEAGKGLWTLLITARNTGLENDALLDVFYEAFAEQYNSEHPYGIFLFYDRYDIPVKGKDHKRLGESERMFEYLICAVCPVNEDYEAGIPECGFIFPAYDGEGAALNCIDIYECGKLKSFIDKML